MATIDQASTQGEVSSGPKVDDALAAKFQALREVIQGLGSAVVAYSAGVDSTLVLWVAHDVLGKQAIAATGLSDTYPEEEMDEAHALAAEIGVEHVMVRTEELTDPRYALNSHQRCFFCKNELYSRLRELADQRGLAHIIDGSNADDLGDHRPGMRAARQLGVRSPLQEVGFTKDEIRTMSQALGLRTWDKPAFACLSSRFPYGTPITIESLRQVADAERALRRLGFRGFRVRHHDSVARIEVAPAEFGRVIEHAAEISRAIKAAGYRFVTLDLQGYRSGSLNEGLSPKLIETQQS
ncbi:MAG TPA: ATP-dependent sacrificial sulfur transferase LarE [Thermomicrobiaceae bacterium]|nr:ATP-dependent sacrificial sulfur transferase LarE [Thermomicrobiaceae bacterium]